MRQVDIREAKEQLAHLIDQAAAGWEIIILKSGKPVAKLVSIGPARAPRQLGPLCGQIWLAEDFDAPLPPEVLVSRSGDDQ